MTVFGTDEYQKGADGSYKFFNDYTAQLNGDVDFIRNTWTDFYAGINTANTVIDAAKTANVPDATKTLRVAEAKFLRALYYFTLVRTYGDVPLPLDADGWRRDGHDARAGGEGVRRHHRRPEGGRSGAARQGGAVRPRRQAGGAAPPRRGLPHPRWRGDDLGRLRPRRGRAAGGREQSPLRARSRTTGACGRWGTR